MTLAERAVGIARAELEQRELAVTRQYLALHEIAVTEDGHALVVRVDAATERGTFHVYFGLRGVPYHCVVAVRPTEGGGLALSWVYIQPATRVYLAIRSPDMTPAEITRRIGLEPTRTWAKGAPPRAGAAPTATHLWALDGPDRPGELDEKMNAVLAAVEGRPLRSRRCDRHVPLT